MTKLWGFYLEYPLFLSRGSWYYIEQCFQLCLFLLSKELYFIKSSKIIIILFETFWLRSIVENILTQNNRKVGNTVIMRLHLVQSRHCSRLLLQEEVSHESDFLDDEKIESTNKNPFLPIFECCMEWLLQNLKQL